MSARRIDGFFYGLFMDSDVLLENEVSPQTPRRAYVDDFALRLGQRATLTPCAGARAYGMVFALTHRELERLYSGPGLEAYVPEAVMARTLEGRGDSQTIAALCYNLIDTPGPDETNPDYAARLRTALRRLDFPSDYVKSIS